MILAFEFNYISHNGVLENLLDKISKDFGISYKIGKKNSVVTLYTEGSEQELTDFSNFIGERLPLSIFFKSSAVNVLNAMPTDEYQLSPCTLTLPYTPKVLLTCRDEHSPDYLNPLLNNEVGNSTYSAHGVLLKQNGNIIINATNNFEPLYSQVAKIISSGARIAIHSASGNFIVGKIDETFKDKVKEDFTVIPTDLSVVEKMVVIKDNEIKAIASLEKPSIRLKVNSLYSEKDILGTQRVKIKLPDELLLLNICTQLHRDGIEFIYKVPLHSEVDYSLEIDGTFSPIPQIEICVLENGEMLIVDGDGYSAPLVKENLKKFNESSHAVFSSIMQEHDLFGESVSCYYISKTHDDKLMYISPKTGLLDLVKFPIKRSFKEIFELIESSQTGASLFKNYKEQYPDLVEHALHVKIPDTLPNNVYTMWGIAAVILGITQSIEEGSEKFIENAEDFGGQKGPRIDYFLQDPKALKSDFDFIKMIRSAMSFRLAGTDDVTLSFGFLESLAYFLTDSTDAFKENLESQKILLGGWMFGIKIFSELSSRNIQATLPVCFNRELPIDN